MSSSRRDEIVDGLNVFRALEAWGAELYAAWAMGEGDPHLRAGHLIIAEREANHARLLAERIRALGAVPGPACVDGVLARSLAELRDLRGLVAQLDGFRAANQRDAEPLAHCQQTLDRGFAAARETDPATHRFWAQLYSEEKVSTAWYRAKYSELSGRRQRSESLPVLEPEQVVRRAESGGVPGIEGAADCSSPA
jgi:hypothetical protein